MGAKSVLSYFIILLIFRKQRNVVEVKVCLKGKPYCLLSNPWKIEAIEHSDWLVLVTRIVAVLQFNIPEC